MRREAAVHAAFPPLSRVRIEQLACCEPAGVGLCLTHWSTRALARMAVRQGIVPQIAHSTVSLILRGADLQPHRFRYWKTPVLDQAFIARAAAVLWCYEHVRSLLERDELVLCWDEKPNLQAVERKPRTFGRPRQVQRQEFDYIRHGVVNFGAALVVHSGMMQSWFLERNNSAHLCCALADLFHHYRRARRIHLIWDNGPSHISQATSEFLGRYGGWIRVLFTPKRASWLNQGELLLRAFTAHYLERGSWCNQEELVRQVLEGTIEYDEVFAHPFTWTWSRQDMRNWVHDQLDRLDQRTCRTLH